MKHYRKSLTIGLLGLVITLLIAFVPAFAIARFPSHGLKQTVVQSSMEQQVEQGRTLYRSGNYEDALRIWEIAARFFQERNDAVGAAMVLSNMALTHRQLGQWAEANDAIATSFRLLDSAPGRSVGFPLNGGDRARVLAQVYNTQGSLQLLQGQLETALTAWQQATAIYRHLENLQGIAQSTINQTQAMRALGLHLQAQRLLQDLAGELNDMPPSAVQVSLYHSLGEALRLLGDFDEAEAQFQASLEIAQNLNLTDELSGSYVGLGNVAHNQGKLLSAELLYTQALEAARSPLLRSQAQLNLLAVLMEQTKVAEFQTLWPTIDAELATMPLNRDVLMAKINLAQRLIQLNQQTQTPVASFDNMRGSLTTTLNQAETLGDRRIQSYAIGLLGHLYEQMSNWTDGEVKPETLSGVQDPLPLAQDLTEEALKLVSSIDAPEISYRWQWQLGRLYEVQGKLSQALNAYALAYERVKSLRQDLFATSSEIRFNFRDEVEALYRQYISLLLRVSDAGTMQAMTGRLPSLPNSDPDAFTPTSLAKDTLTELQLADLENLLDCSLASFDALSLDETVDAIADQSITTDSKTAIFYPIVLDDRVEVLLKLPSLVGKDQQSNKQTTPAKAARGLKRYQPIPVARDEVEQMLTDLRRELERPYFSSKRGRPKAQQVYDWLIRPAETDLENAEVKTLVFVLDGSLRNIPMAALHDGQQFLVEKYAIALALGNLQLPQTEPSKEFRVLAAGLSEKPELSDDQNIFGPLPFVQRELDSIQVTVPNTKALRNPDFTQNKLEAALELGDYNVVHLATHGQFSTRRQDTFILTAPADADTRGNVEPESGAETQTDSKVDLNELDTLFRRRDRNPLELLVLSACETASGDSREVLGIAGMAVQTGARTTLASLWNVDDSSTAELMQTFYQELLKVGVSRAEALRRAQLRLIGGDRRGLYRPSHWAPYVLVGDWR